MNYNTLKKCIDELQKEKPCIEYVLGLLEALYDANNTVPSYPYIPPIDIGTNPIMFPTTGITSQPQNPSKQIIGNEAVMMDKEARAKLATVKAMSKLE